MPKLTKAEQMAAQAAAAQAAPVLDYLTTTTPEPTEQEATSPVNVDKAHGAEQNANAEEQETGKKKKKATKNGMVLKSFYCSETVFDQLSELAGYRSIIKGKKNNRGQNIGAGTLINEAATEYLEKHMDELNQWRQLMQPVKNGIPWTYTTTAPDGTIVTENHGDEE